MTSHKTFSNRLNMIMGGTIFLVVGTLTLHGSGSGDRFSQGLTEALRKTPAIGKVTAIKTFTIKPEVREGIGRQSISPPRDIERFKCPVVKFRTRDNKPVQVVDCIPGSVKVGQQVYVVYDSTKPTSVVASKDSYSSAHWSPVVISGLQQLAAGAISLFGATRICLGMTNTTPFQSDENSL